MKDVIVEITAENLDLKKRSRIERSPATPSGVAARGHELGRTHATTQWRPTRRTLATLEIGAARYYRWRRHTRGTGGETPTRRGSLYELLASERQAILDYARTHPAVRHRELAWKMVDEGICNVSSSSVYRVLREANLVCRWKPKPKVKGLGRDAQRASCPDQKWQTDIKYVWVR